MGDIAVFIDGAYLDKTCESGGTRVRIDHEALVGRICAGHALFRAYYFDSPPFQSNPPTDAERRRMSEKQSFFAHLERLPRFKVRQGTCVRRYDQNGRLFYQQKGVDVHLAVDLVRVALRDRVGDIAVVTGDADLIPAINVAVDEGIIVHLYHGRHCPTTLMQACDDCVLMDATFLDSLRTEA